MRSGGSAPLVAHVLYRFDVGGLENGVVNLLNHMPSDRYRHVVVALTECEKEFSRRLRRDDVRLISLRKPPGQGFRLFPRFYRLMRELRPEILHTRNLAALEMAVPAALARVPVRIHGEHGWDAHDPDGSSRKYQAIRRAFSPFVHRYVALSGELERYLVERVGIGSRRVTRICNGVDLERFRALDAAGGVCEMPFDRGAHYLFGTVGRLDRVKDQASLVRAFGQLCDRNDAVRRRARLVIVGDGPCRHEVERAVAECAVGELVWMAGARSDVPSLLAALDCFVLPSLGEGISNTILEAMSCALPVIATRVGGNPELVVDGETGRLVPSADVPALAAAMEEIFVAPQTSMAFGMAARRRIEAQYSLDSMVGSYLTLYEQAMRDQGCARARDLLS